MATLQERLIEAETAYHDLQVGRAAVEVRDGDGSLVRYTAANSARLARYIESLKTQIAASAANQGPMRPFFL